MSTQEAILFWTRVGALAAALYSALTVILLGIVWSQVAEIREQRKATNNQQLIQQAMQINEFITREGVAGPYAVLLKVPNDRLKPFNGKVVALLNQLNLLRQVFESRESLGTAAERVYLNWARKVVRPWIQHDPELERIWSLYAELEDVAGGSFLQWVEPYLGNPRESHTTSGNSEGNVRQR